MKARLLAPVFIYWAPVMSHKATETDLVPKVTQPGLKPSSLKLFLPSISAQMP